jgi:hypothetical protein
VVWISLRAFLEQTNLYINGSFAFNLEWVLQNENLLNISPRGRLEIEPVISQGDPVEVTITLRPLTHPGSSKYG